MKRVQIYSPHPDDAEIFCGGTLIKHQHAGDRLQFVLLTRGDKGTRNPWLKGDRLAAIRTAEMTQRVRLLPGAELIWLDFEDGAIELSDAAVLKIRAQIQAGSPDLIYLPERREFSIYRHPDHAATNELVERALEDSDAPVTLRYYHTRNFNTLIDVSQYERENCAAIRCHASQYKITTLPACLLYRRELLRYLFLSRWGWKNNWKVHEAINRLVAVAHLPVKPGTEAFREVSSSLQGSSLGSAKS